MKHETSSSSVSVKVDDTIRSSPLFLSLLDLLFHILCIPLLAFTAIETARVKVVGNRAVHQESFKKV